MGLPGLSGFVAELQILIGTWYRYPLLAALSGIGIVVTAAYVLRVLHKGFYGEPAKKFHAFEPITSFEKAAGNILVATLIVVGLYPPILVTMIYGTVEPLIRSLFP